MDSRSQHIYRKVCIFQIVAVILSMGGLSLIAPGPMIGDEVGHFYLLKAIADNLPDLTLTYHIPVAWSDIAMERYCNHTFLWHIIGALVYRVLPWVFSVQLYHLLFFAQFLTVFYLFARDFTHRDYFCVCWALMLMWSIPMFLLFGTLFYKDVPVAAQIITVFYLIYRRKYSLSLMFWILALLLKETAVIMLPALLFYYIWRLHRVRAKMYVMVAASVLLTELTFVTEGMILTQVLPHTTPLIVEQLQAVVPWLGPVSRIAASSPETVEGGNCPGNLNILYNWLIYPGIGFWFGLWMAVVGAVWRLTRASRLSPLDWRVIVDSYGVISLLIAFSYIIPATMVLWPNNCDIRYYCPAMPFLIFSFAYWSGDLLRRMRWLLPLAAIILILQTGLVFHKIVKMRNLSPGIRGTIEFLEKQHAIIPEGRIFMYPEGNSRFFPYEAVWTRDNLYFDIMKADNRQRAAIWLNHRVVFVVVRKYMVSGAAPDVARFGSYPAAFVADLYKDRRRFPVLLENEQMVVFGIRNCRKTEKTALKNHR